MALSGHVALAAECPLSGVKRPGKSGHALRAGNLNKLAVESFVIVYPFFRSPRPQLRRSVASPRTPAERLILVVSRRSERQVIPSQVARKIQIRYPL